jgi:enhancer of mRNA-decapping protein 3
MAAEFVGYTILVTLRTPANAQLQGVVANVIDQKLILQDGEDALYSPLTSIA